MPPAKLDKRETRHRAFIYTNLKMLEANLAEYDPTNILSPTPIPNQLQKKWSYKPPKKDDIL